jgi:ADP-heptose:LPS heptosyltransferase
MTGYLLKGISILYPSAKRFIFCKVDQSTLFQSHPYGFKPLIYDPRSLGALFKMMAQTRARAKYSIAYVLGDNRYAWIARCLGASKIYGFAGGRKVHRWMLDEEVEVPDAPKSLPEILGALAGVVSVTPFEAKDWPLPVATRDDIRFSELLSRINSRGCKGLLFFHTGASDIVKTWLPVNWSKLSKHFTDRGYFVILSCGRGESYTLPSHTDIDADRTEVINGQLSIEDICKLMRLSRLVVSPDTGVSHLARIVQTPSVTLFGPGNPRLCADSGGYWDTARHTYLFIDDIQCRDQNTLFKRNISWLRKCNRDHKTCVGDRVCMKRISVEATISAAENLLDRYQYADH